MALSGGNGTRWSAVGHEGLARKVFGMKTLFALALNIAVTTTLGGALQGAAVAQTGNAPFCLKRGPTGQVSCIYPTMGECERARGTVSGDQCITRSDAGGTTGLGDSTAPPRESPVTPRSPAPER